MSYKKKKQKKILKKEGSDKPPLPEISILSIIKVHSINNVCKKGKLCSQK